MADISRFGFLRHLRAAPTSWVRQHSRGRVRHEGVSQSFYFRALTSALSEVPVDDRELPLLFHARTSDFADVTVQATVTYRIKDPALAANRLDFSIDPVTGAWRAQPLDQLATVLAELAQQPALDLLIGMTLTEALSGVGRVRGIISAALADDARLAELGVSVASARVVAIRPEPELERALQTPTREAVQGEADRATYERRATAVERERAIAENELQSKIELARREQQLIEQKGANTRRRAETDAAAELVTVQARLEREKAVALAAADTSRVTTAAEAERGRLIADANADATRVVGLAQAEVEAAKLAAYRDMDPEILHALAVRELAGQLPEIGQLTITPDLVSKFLGR
ncbi:hypothetical protein Lfu02_24540 [Longispora fulva]|uniref:Regulator of protease activity HflC (Stomatin/prohibitin superfamily) n=1 Tax=Longispora fulva TaxID=619741 RepID=A0A8J7GU43_9ACTN|nr:SPFH domain-containing protein [Longispora fulva]MBG6139535.1 regulator of protease activity HflC (stomatin/prohibitin superfamily) [Longispora fulva]GIG58082.1 hypothetical protein Lfu02_24540 [Longispora fulva]